MSVGKGSLERLNEAVKSVKEEAEEKAGKEEQILKEKQDPKKQTNGSVISKMTCELPFYLL